MDSYKALIIPAMFSGFGIFMMKQHIETIPDEIIEAARMDGANEFYIFHRIIFPMAKKRNFKYSYFSVPVDMGRLSVALSCNQYQGKAAIGSGSEDV